MAHRHRAARAPRSACRRAPATLSCWARWAICATITQGYARPRRFRELRDVPHGNEVLSPRQIVEAACGLRHLEIVGGRHLDVRAERLSRWMLAVAA
jgi:hypothetical protein